MSDELTTTEPRRPLAALQAQADGVMAIIPRNLEEAQRYANGLIMAGIVPDAFKHSKDVLGPPGSDELVARAGEINAPLVLMGVLKAMELGVAPQTGLSGLLPLNGRFTVWGDLAAGLVQHGGQVANQQVTKLGTTFDPETPPAQWPDEYGYEVRYWRRDQPDPYIGRFTVRDAKRANLWNNSKRVPWVLYPDRMLFNRARAFALRDGFADALSGLSIAEEVLDTMPPVEESKRIEPRKLAALTSDEPEIAPQRAQDDSLPETTGDAAIAPQEASEGQGDGEQPSLV